MMTDPPGPARWLQVPWYRRGVATIGTLAASTWVVAGGDSWPEILWLPTSLLLAAAFLLHVNRFTAQVLARAVWWQALVLGGLLCCCGNSREGTAGLVLALGSGTALLALGRGGLEGEAPSRWFKPLAFRGVLITAITMALADAQVLLLWGGLRAEERVDAGWGPNFDAWLLLGCGAVMLLAVYGLLRLRVWGMVLTVVANVVIAWLAASRTLEIPREAGYALVATAVVQLLLPIPIVVAFVRKTTPRPPTISTWRYAVAASVVALLMVCAVGAVILRRC